MSEMPWIDYSLLAIMGFSGLAGLMRGLVREILSLVSWIVAAWVALHHAQACSVLFASVIAIPPLRMAAGFITLFLTTLLVTSIVGWVITRLLQTTGLSSMDQLAGLLFGVARGVLIVMVLAFAGSLTPLTQEPWWKESRLLPTFQSLAGWLRGKIPSDYNDYLKFSIPTQP